MVAPILLNWALFLLLLPPMETEWLQGIRFSTLRNPARIWRISSGIFSLRPDVTCSRCLIRDRGMCPKTAAKKNYVPNKRRINAYFFFAKCSASFLAYFYIRFRAFLIFYSMIGYRTRILSRNKKYVDKFTLFTFPPILHLSFPLRLRRNVGSLQARSTSLTLRRGTNNLPR